MTFNEIIDLVYQKLGDPARKDRTSVYINKLINDAQRNLAMELRFFKKSTVLTSVANQQEYLVGGGDVSLTTPSSAPDGVEGVGAGSLMTGTYKYKICWYAEEFEIVSALNTTELEVVITGDNRLAELYDFPTRSESIVSHCDIYRTEVNGSVYKYLIRRTYSATTGYTSGAPYLDTAGDVTLGDEHPGAGTYFGDLIDVISAWYDDEYEIKTRLPYPLPDDIYSSGNPYSFYVYNDYLGLVPKPSESGKNIDVYYTAIPPLLTLNDIPKVPEAFRILLAYYALWQAFEDDGDFNRAKFYMAMFEEGKNKFRASLGSSDGPTQIENWLF
jgi:hypothetical protein